MFRSVRLHTGETWQTSAAEDLGDARAATAAETLEIRLRTSIGPYKATDLHLAEGQLCDVQGVPAANEQHSAPAGTRGEEARGVGLAGSEAAMAELDASHQHLRLKVKAEPTPTEASLLNQDDSISNMLY